MLKKPQFIFIDIDNTLLDFDKCSMASARLAAASQGLTLPDNIWQIFKPIHDDFWQRLERGEITIDQLHQQRWNVVLQAAGLSGDGLLFEHDFRTALKDQHIEVEGARDLLVYLSARYPLAAASNGPSAQQIKRLSDADLAPYFSYVFVSEDMGANKPSAAFFDACFETVNADRQKRGQKALAPEDTLMIGDSITADIRGARSYGMATLWYDHDKAAGPGRMEADEYVRDLGQIQKILQFNK